MRPGQVHKTDFEEHFECLEVVSVAGPLVDAIWLEESIELSSAATHSWWGRSVCHVGRKSGLDSFPKVATPLRPFCADLCKMSSGAGLATSSMTTQW